jgi:tetratricopeptide (TPR) repeat protein
MTRWKPFPHAGMYAFDAASLKLNWPRLHRGDCEPLPKDDAVLQAWVLFHNGEFQLAAEAGLDAGGDGITVANKATCIYANYLESREKVKFDLFMQAVGQAEAQQAEDPQNANAWFWQAYALGRYSQGISVTKALAQGLGSKVKTALEQTIKLSPRHADARIALATFHAEVIDKVGTLIGNMTFGARKDTGLALFREALTLNPASAIALTEFANGMVMFEGDKRIQEATRLYQQAAAFEPLDATEWLDVDMARIELHD